MSDGNEQITLEDVYKTLIGINEHLTKKIDKIEGEIKNFKQKIDVEINEVKTKVSELETENQQLKNKITDLERKFKRKNIVIYGLRETQSENLTSKVEDLIINKLQVNIKKSDFSNIFRIGKKVDNRNRPVLVELISQFIRNDILRNRTKLKGSNIYLSEDLVPEDREGKKIIYEAYKEAKLLKKSATIKGTKLLIEGTTFTLKDIRETKHLDYCQTSDYHSPPPPRRTHSEPSTPICDHSSVFEENESPVQSPKPEKRNEEKARKLEETPEISVSLKNKKSFLYHLRSTSTSKQ